VFCANHSFFKSPSSVLLLAVLLFSDQNEHEQDNSDADGYKKGLHSDPQDVVNSDSHIHTVHAVRTLANELVIMLYRYARIVL